MPPQNYRKRRIQHGPNKNELKSARHEQGELERARSGTLRSRFPQVSRMDLDLRLETPQGAVLEHVQRTVGLDEAFQLDVVCPGGCSGGHFLLTDAAEALLNASQETRQGMGICEAASYMDSKLPCGTKLHYQISIQYNPS